MRLTATTISAICLLLTAVTAAGEPIYVADDASLRRAVNGARPGTRIVLAAGKYSPGISASGLRGDAKSPILIEAADAKDKPVFEGGRLGIHLSDCAHLVLRNIVVRGQEGNGINIDDGGTFDTPAHHVTLEGVEVSDVGPQGNRDAIKLSGVDDLVVRGCSVEGWGGQAIDMVGCHRALVEGCTFVGKPGFTQSGAVQAKGGSSEVTVRNCTFVNAGQRGVNVGGSTALRVFRPPGAKYEAKDVTVEGCRFVGGFSPIAFVGVDGAVVRYNTIYRPERWAVRILQETTEPLFVPSRNGRFERNLVVYRRERVREVVNVGPETDPASFTFKENYWFCEDRPGRSRPELPVREAGGVYGPDPGVKLSEGGVPSAQGAKGFGADALPEVERR